jgi:hypothetical protein
MLMSNADLARKFIALESKYDAQFKIVFDAIRELIEGPAPSPKPRIGFYALTASARRPSERWDLRPPRLLISTS